MTGEGGERGTRSLRRLRLSWPCSRDSPVGLPGGDFGVGAGSVDVRDFRSHRAKLRPELAAMVDAVVARECHELRARHLQEAEEIEDLGHLLRWDGA